MGAFKIDDTVKVNTRILKKTNEKMKTIKLDKEPGTVCKICCDDHYYIKTKFGVHYLHISKFFKMKKIKS